MNKKQFINFLEIIKYIEDRSNELNSSLQKFFNDKKGVYADDKYVNIYIWDFKPKWGMSFKGKRYIIVHIFILKSNRKNS